MTNWLWAGGLIAALSAGWNQVKSLWAQLSSLLIITVIVQGDLTSALLMYLQERARTARMGPQTYLGVKLYVRALSRVQLIAYQFLGRTGAVYFINRTPLWVKREGKQDQDNGSISFDPFSLSISFLRGTLRADDLIVSAVSHYNKIRDGCEQNHEQRHYVRRVYGLSKKIAMHMGRDQEGKSQPSIESSRDTFGYRIARPLVYTFDDLGKLDSPIQLSALALSEQAEEAVEEVRRWINSEAWFKERGVPWKRGWLLYGNPGNGKTALTRALAEEFDLPVYIYDLASLANDEFQNAWQEMLSSVPCIALIEDIDAVFDGRKTAVGDLTFDCLLNCLDGIERSDGLLTIITTNQVDRIDPALGIAVDCQSFSTRPGRVDKAIHMTPPDRAGRLKIAQRILPEYPTAWQHVVEDGESDTGAQFQERCVKEALKKFWEES